MSEAKKKRSEETEKSISISEKDTAWKGVTALATRENYEQRLNSKIKLTRLLYQRGFAKEDILNLYTFIDWVMVLPKDLEIIYNNEIEQFEETQQMAFITGMEQRGIDKGFQMGFRTGTARRSRSIC